MGSPQYGRLILDGEEISGANPIESQSLLWSYGTDCPRCGLCAAT
jgi:hypothetical protein